MKRKPRGFLHSLPLNSDMILFQEALDFVGRELSAAAFPNSGWGRNGGPSLAHCPAALLMSCSLQQPCGDTSECLWLSLPVALFHLPKPPSSLIPRLLPWHSPLDTKVTCAMCPSCPLLVWRHLTVRLLSIQGVTVSWFTPK